MDEDGLPPPRTGRGRELVGRRRAAPPVDTGRRHHLGATPAQMPVIGPDGALGVTRTNAVQVASLTRTELVQLEDTITSEMTEAADGQQFELAAALRDERDAVLAELARRDNPQPSS